MKMRLLSIIIIIVAGITVTTTTLFGSVSRERDYQTAITSARKFASNDVPYTAVQRYREAFSIRLGSE